MYRWRVVITTGVVALVVGLGLLGCGRSMPTGSEARAAAPAPELIRVGRAPVSITGRVGPRRDAALSFAVAGRVQQILVTDGQAVKAGQELVRLQAPGLERAVQRAEANLKAARAQLDKAKAGLRPEQIAAAEATLAGARADEKTAEVAVDKARDQLASAQADQSVIEKADPEVAQAYRAASQAEITRARAAVRTAQSQLAQAEAQAASWRARADLAKAQFDLAKAGARSEDIAAAEAAVAIAETALADAQGNLADLVLRAPFDGVIGAVIAGEGELVSAQTPVVRLGDHRLRVRAQDLNAADVGRVRVGQTATIKGDAPASRALKAHVSALSPVGFDRRGVDVYTVILDLDSDQADNLSWGMTVQVDIRAE